eukprot:TRINITY_DN31484_c0_g1_i1.p1 TRINITY_DN31484_c0_g1~~TRINITY_DN31484_c0_g1_i1.p1  ORF type:complete len:165 (-),score=16.88 TRINITY_DN31484_c0_g1_i1:436-930(-)
MLRPFVVLGACALLAFFLEGCGSGPAGSDECVFHVTLKNGTDVRINTTAFEGHAVAEQDSNCCRSMRMSIQTLLDGAAARSCSVDSMKNVCTDCPHTHDWVGLPDICSMVMHYGCACEVVHTPGVPDDIVCRNHSTSDLASSSGLAGSWTEEHRQASHEDVYSV